MQPCDINRSSQNLEHDEHGGETNGLECNDIIECRLFVLGACVAYSFVSRNARDKE